MAGDPNGKRKTPGRFFWRLCLQTAGTVGVFFIVLSVCQMTTPEAMQWKAAMRQSFTDDMNFTPVMEWLSGKELFEEQGAVQASASLSNYGVKEAVVVPVSGKVELQEEQNEFLYITTAGNEEILAAYAGTVTDIVMDDDKHIIITLSHPNGFVTTYGGCAECYVTLDEPIQKGQIIARTGDHSEEQFYFSASYLGNQVDPLTLLLMKEDTL